jgi:two-component system response regulator MprA
MSAAGHVHAHRLIAGEGPVTEENGSAILRPLRRVARAALRVRVRAPRRHGEPSSVLRFADVTLDPRSRHAARGARPVRLTPKEFLLLELFLRHPGRVLTRSEIYERVWGYDFGTGSNSLGVYVGYLRRKLEAGGEPRLIQTVRGVGYALLEAS